MILLGTRLEAPEDDHDDVCHDEDDDDLPPSLSPDIGPRPCPPHLNTAVCYNQRRKARNNILFTFPFTLNFSKSMYGCANVWKKT